MSKAPPSPSFRPPQNSRRLVMPNISLLKISTPETNPVTSKDEISPVIPLEPSIIEPERARRESNHVELKISPPTPKPNSQCQDDDIYALDDEGWSRVANSGGIEELLSLGEGISGAVTKCRLRKSGQVFAIKVCLPSSFPFSIMLHDVLI
jgi:hypothetical protein